MNCIQKMLAAALGCVLSALLLTGCGEKDVTVSVTLVNRSGREISSISITPSTSTEWDTEFVDGAFADGETISASLGTYKESEVPSAYNILVYNDENYILYDTSVDELDFAIQDGDYIIFLPPAATSKPLIFFLCKNFYNLVTTIDYLLPPPGPRGSHESPRQAPRWIPE